MATNSARPSTLASIIPYKTFEATEPSSGRMAVAIAGYPYSARAAILDIVDNSIAAGASGVSISLPADPAGDIVISDNGIGVDPKIISEVLRAGSRVQDRYAPLSLSRYGIGLKGAGFSLGGEITLLTKFSGEPLRRRAISRSLIETVDEWVQDTRDPEQNEEKFFKKNLVELPGTNHRETGTVAVIGKLNLRSRDIAKLKTDIVRAVGETYQKFLNSGMLAIRLNDTDIEPIDPLHRENPATLVLYKREPITLSNGATVYFSAVSLPHPLQVAQDLRRRYRYAQVNQGFYLYRNGRLIRSGETLGLFNYDFHLNAFRAELEYSTDGDEHITVDVAKSIGIVTSEIQQKLQEYVTVCRKTCDTLWRERDVITAEDIQGLFDDSNKLIASRANLLVEGIDTRKKKSRMSGGGNGNPGAPTVATGTKVTSIAPTTPASTPTTNVPTATKALPVPPLKVIPRDIPYLQPVDALPADVLYRPIWNGDVNAVVVQVNKSHPFYKAVFSKSSGEGRDSLPRAAATATQQLIYVLGATEWNVATDDELERLFEQYRRFASMNLRALLE